MIEAVLFDLDGTLIEFNYNYVSARRLVIARMVEMGVDSSVLSESRPVSINVENAIVFMQEKGLSEEEVRVFRRKVYEAVEPLELEAAGNPVLREGAQNLLSWLRRRGMKMAVCTNNCSMASEIILRKTRLKKFFMHVLTRNDAERLKPFPDIILRACEKLEVSPGKTVYVGDSPIDVAAAKNAGVKPVGIASGLWSAEKLRDAGAELVASNMDELRGLLSALMLE